MLLSVDSYYDVTYHNVNISEEYSRLPTGRTKDPLPTEGRTVATTGLKTEHNPSHKIDQFTLSDTATTRYSTA